MKHTMLPVLAILIAGAAGGCDGAEKRLTNPEDAAPQLTVGSTNTVTVACPGRLDRGTSGTCVAFAYDVYGYLVTQAASWSSSTTSIATVSSTGEVTGSSSATGTTTITATIDNVPATATVAVGNSNAPAPTAFIGGPSSVRPGAQCTWIAAIGDTDDPPLTFTWSQSAGTGTGSATTYYGSSTTSFTLYLTVTDGNGHSSSTSKNVTVAHGAPVCPS